MSTKGDILVVDDESEIVRLVVEVLSDEGYTLRVAYDGRDALREVSAAAPALVLLDYWMPGMTGAEVLQTLRSAGYGELPVIIMSAGTRGDTAQQCGASAFLPKPFDLIALIACVEQFFAPAAQQGLAKEANV